MGDLSLYCNVEDFSFALSPSFQTPIQNPLRLIQGFDILVDQYFVEPTGNPAAPWTYLDPVAYTGAQLCIAQTNQGVPPYLALATGPTYHSGAQPYLEYLLGMTSANLTNALDISPALQAVFEADWINGTRQFITQCKCFISRSVLYSGGNAPIPPSSYSNFVQNYVGRITALSSGTGTLSGIATANGATSIDTSVMFTVSGITMAYFLRVGTDATSAGVQRPDDFNASTNAVVWQQFL